jgi:hypothetical protein
MLRERSEVISFTRDDLERIVRYMAQQQIAGPLFIGKFGEQVIRWTTEGGVEVITKYVQGGYADLPVVSQSDVERLDSPKKKHKR